MEKLKYGNISADTTKQVTLEKDKTVKYTTVAPNVS